MVRMDLFPGYVAVALRRSILGLVAGIIVGVALALGLGLVIAADPFWTAVYSGIVGAVWAEPIASGCATRLGITGGARDGAIVSGTLTGAVLLVSWPVWGQIVNANVLYPDTSQARDLASAVDDMSAGAGPFLLATAAILVAVYALAVGGVVLGWARLSDRPA
jgi:hypothetical protein